MKPLFLTLILAPLAFAQTNPGKPPVAPAVPLIHNTFTTANLRAEKIAEFKAREARLNARSMALGEEQRLWNEKAAQQRKANNANSPGNPGGGGFQAGLQVTPEYLQRVKSLKDEASLFQRDILEEMRIKKQLVANAETNQKAIALKQSLQAGTPAAGAATQLPTATPTPAPQPGQALPVAKAVPSSVPGLPAGLEPSKKPQPQPQAQHPNQQSQPSNLPPGVSRKN